MTDFFNDLKIAIVYDWIDKWGGVERVLLILHQMFPQANFFTSYFDKDKALWAKDLRIKTSFIQKLPGFIRGNRLVSLPFYPFAFESLNFNAYNLVISVTSSFAKAIITRPGTVHICYLLTPTRFLWSHQEDYIKKSYGLGVRSYVEYLKKWDKIVSKRPDYIISISKTVADRCKKYYDRESEIIYPPFDKKYWNDIISKIKYKKSNMQIKNKKYFLVVSRLEMYKKVELVVKAFNQLPKLNLIIVGKGTKENKLKKLAGENIQFLRDLSDEELGWLYKNARALIMPQEEDFGYTALEAQFFGCPVIAYKEGGATETVIENKTGIFFKNQNIPSLAAALERFDKVEYNLKESTLRLGKKNIESFGRERFENRFRNLLISKL